MKKWIILGCVGILAVIVVVIVIGLSNLGPAIKAAVNNYGPKITKTEARLGDVDVSLFSAKATLKNFFLGNPAGFKSPEAMSVKSIFVDIDEKTLTKDTIVIDKIEVVAPQITYEKIKGTDNLQTILNHVKKSVGVDEKAGKSAGKEKKEGETKILIKDFIVKDGRVNLVMSLLGQRTLSAGLPDIHLKNIGEKKGGATPAEAFKEIFSSLYSKIQSPAVTNVFNKGIKELAGGAQVAAEKAKKQLQDMNTGAKEGISAAKDKLKGLFGK